MTKKIMKRPSAADNKIKRPAAAPRRAAASGRGDTIEAVEEDWSDCETLIMGPPEKARKKMLKKPSAAVGAEASEDVPGSPNFGGVGDEPMDTHRRDCLE